MQREKYFSALGRAQTSLPGKASSSLFAETHLSSPCRTFSVLSKTHGLVANKSRSSVRNKIGAWALLCTFSAMFALVAAAAVAQELPAAKPETVGMSAERLERIGATVQKSIDDKRIAGAVTLVARRGRVVWFKPQGMMDREANKGMRTDTIFRICSMTKPITSVAVMMLYEEGRFTLNEPVSNFIPEFKDMKVLDPPYAQDKTSPPGALANAKHLITIRHLLTHTAGLTYHWNARLGKRYREVGMGHGILQQEGTIGDAVKKLASLPLLFHPGDA